MIKSMLPTIFVSDMDRSVDFYSRVLGFRITFRHANDWCSLAGPDGSQLGLHGVGPDSPEPGGGGIQIGFYATKPLDEAVAELKARGCELTKPIVDDDPVRLAFIKDPDGHVLYFCEMKY